jgi:hypothetical protein
MSTASKVLTWGLIAAGAYWLYEKYNTATNLVFSFSNVYFGSVSIGQPIQGTVTFNIQNPTAGSITIDSLIGTINIPQSGASGAEVATINSQTVTAIGPGQTVSYPVNFTVAPNNVVSDLVEVITTASSLQTNFNGTVTLNGIGVPVNTTISD